MKFFVMIYSYRDYELEKTITNLFETADNPEDIRVGCINADDTPLVSKWKHKVDILNVDYKQYHGCGRGCWEILQKLYKKEDYIIKIDPHTRFDKGWDTYYSKFLKPDRVVVSRCLGYHPDGTRDNPETAYSKPLGWHNIQGIHLKGTNYTGIKKKIFFFNAGFFIAPRKWVKKVGYDPHIAMWGEEMDLSCRTFLKGYKIINVPSKVYHLYGRRNRKSVDSSDEFEEANRAGIIRAKIKVGLLPHDAKYMQDWDKYGCDGSAYKAKMEEIFLSNKQSGDEKTEPKINATIFKYTDIMLCSHCGSKTFYNMGKCKWCYKDLTASQRIQK